MDLRVADKPRLSRKAILATNDLKSEVVHVPEWGGDVEIREMTAGERAAFADLFAGDSVPTDSQARMVQMCAIDDEGERLFEESDIEALSAKSGSALQTLSQKVMELSGMDVSLEDAEKN